MPAFKDITGQRFGRWTVIALHAKPSRIKPTHNSLWLCVCDCGNKSIVDSTFLRLGKSQSCGCLKTERHTKHGHAGSHPTATYHSWTGMWQRCTNPDNPGYSNWGGRGIKVCERWRSFENFLADMGTKPSGYTIERIDNDGNYEPGNCTWIPKSEQWKNKRHQGRRKKA